MHENDPDMPKLSICIPTYGRLPYLKELLHNLLQQVEDMPCGAVEVLVSDNCSPDGTACYLHTLGQPFFHWWTNEVNIGGDRNFQKCIQEAHGEYVWLLGDDDLVVEQAVARVLDTIVREGPDLIVATATEGESALYAGYRDFLLASCRKNPRAAMAHTLISANIFRRSVFDLSFAKAKLKTQYAHMFGLMKGMSGSIRTLPHLVSERAVRAPFEKVPSFLCVKQALYLWFLASRFNVPRFRLYAVKNACNLPMEFLSRLKNTICGKPNAV